MFFLKLEKIKILYCIDIFNGIDLTPRRPNSDFLENHLSRSILRSNQIKSNFIKSEQFDFLNQQKQSTSEKNPGTKS